MMILAKSYSQTLPLTPLLRKSLYCWIALNPQLACTVLAPKLVITTAAYALAVMERESPFLTANWRPPLGIDCPSKVPKKAENQKKNSKFIAKLFYEEEIREIYYNFLAIK